MEEVEEDWCEKYKKHKEKFSNYNLLGQSYRILCQLSKTNFDKPEEVKELNWVVKDAANIIGELVNFLKNDILIEEVVKGSSSILESKEEKLKKVV